MTTTKNRPPPGNDKAIGSFFHCGRCVATGVRQDLEAGFTPLGIQVWCRACDANILHVDFEGQKHPANTTAKRKLDPRAS
jgi:hypothetical protein